MNQKTYQQIENYMLRCMQDSAHDAEHVYRVLYNALDIAEHEEGVDYDVLIAACILHDIGRTRQFKDKKRNHAAEGGDMAAAFLKKIDFLTDKIAHVKQCILTHRYRSKKPPATLEAKILFDADKVDVAGAIGVARTLFYQGHVGTALYGVDKDGAVLNGITDETPSFFREYNFKLKHIYDKCYTARADEIAKSRRKAMDDYCNSLFAEVSQTRAVGNKRLKSILKDTADK